jgi:ketosteroid isomerase-like protein
MTTARSRARTLCATMCRTGATTFHDFAVEPVELDDAGEDNVVGVMKISGRAKLSGVETDLTHAFLYTFRDGKIARGREYWTREEALEAARLRD